MRGDRPADARPRFAALVRSAFRNHARYYVELLRAPHYPIERIDEHVEVPDWDRFLPLLRGGPAMLLSSHLGNFEPFGMFIAAHGCGRCRRSRRSSRARSTSSSRRAAARATSTSCRSARPGARSSSGCARAAWSGSSPTATSPAMASR